MATRQIQDYLSSNEATEIKVKNRAFVGDTSGVAEIKMDAKASEASQIVFERAGTTKGKLGLINAANDKLVIEQLAAADIEMLLPAGQNVTAKIGGVFNTIPAVPGTLADGDYKLHVVGGVLSWVTV